MGNKKLLLCILTVWVSLINLWAGPMQAATRIHEWSFEGNTQDSSGSGNHGTVSGGSLTYIAGKVGQAITLDAGESVNALAGTTSNLPTLAADSWSMNIWIKLENKAPSLANLAGFGGNGGAGTDGTRRSYLTYSGTDNNDYYFWGWSRDVSFSPSEYIADSQWHMYTFTFDGATLVAYQDAIQVGTGQSVLINTLDDSIHISGPSYWDVTFAGGFDEFTIWQGVLDFSEIDNLFAGDVRAVFVAPANGICNVTLDSELAWQIPGESTGLSFNVYFDDDQTAVASSASSAFRGSQTETSFSPSGIQPATTYYWRIDVVDGNTVFPGPIWKFTTQLNEPGCLSPLMDIVDDCIVNIEDLVQMAIQWLDEPGSTADLDGIAGIGLADFSLLAKDWLKSSTQIIISEFMASNVSTLADEDGEYSDWIEIRNLADTPVSLVDWFLTDDMDIPGKWQIPEITIEAGGYMVVFASGKNRSNTNGELHTNFQLNSEGEYLALVKPDFSIAHEFAQKFPPQVEGTSYGLTVLPGYDEFVNRYFTSPNPGICNCNSGEILNFVADTAFDVNRGFYTEAFEVRISTGTEGAQIYYTDDASKPAPDNPSATLYTGPIPISSTTTLRAAAFKDNYGPTDVDTHTYIFISDVIGQSTMSTAITNDAVWGPQMSDALVSTPTISLVTPSTISEAETETSIELIYPDGVKGFQFNAGIENFGRTSLGFPKKSMRISFKRFYGPSKLNFDLFGNGATEEFDQILLRAGSHDTPFWNPPSGNKGVYVRNRWMADRQLDMGQPAPHGHFVHVYLNGAYWGQYHLMERPNAPFMASYFGGDKDEYDAINAGAANPVAVSGTMDAWDAMIASTGDYNLLQQYMDVVNYIDYMILNFYGGNDWDWNWPHQGADYNWMAAGKRQEGTGFKFFCWDSDIALRTTVDANVVDRGGPAKMWNTLKLNEEFKMLLADRAQKFYYNNGILTYDRVLATLNELAAGIEQSIIPECARWGTSYGYTPATWQTAMNWITTQFIVQRTETVIQQMRDAGVFPLIDAPVFSINGSYQHGGNIDQGDQLSVSQSESNVIWYTLNGSDPRLVGGSVNPSAIEYTVPFLLSESKHLKARALDNGQWSALSEAVFAVGPVLENLRITEIMYHPAGDPNSEFIELKNIGTEAINLNLVKFANGVDFTFPDITVAAGEYVLVVKNTSAFNGQYPAFIGTIAGEYIGSLDNNGEKMLLQDALGTVIHEFSYKDGWYGIADGQGFTLTVIDPTNADSAAYGDKDTWRASTNYGGTPGIDDVGPNPGDIVINELLAHSDTWPYDWIELYNTTGSEINISGWYLSDNNDDDPNLMKYRIAEGTTIAGNGYLVFTKDQHFGESFALSENGEKVCLTSAAGSVLTGYREVENFGASEVEVSFGRYYKSSTDTYNFVSMSSSTAGNNNAYPKVGPIVISEIMYHPIPGGSFDKDEYEYIELCNISGLVVSLFDEDLQLGWKFTDGIDYTFDQALTVNPGKRIIIARNLAAFAERYTVPTGTHVLGPFENDTNLKNSGEQLQLGKPGDIDVAYIRQYIRVDRVTYSDGSHPADTDLWPKEADGKGKSLTRIVLTLYGNDLANWQAMPPNPAQ